MPPGPRSSGTRSCRCTRNATGSSSSWPGRTSGSSGSCSGFTGRRGQWWSDRIAAAAPAEIVAEWVGGHFEIVHLAVMVEAQRQGLGAALLDGLLADLPNEKALLTTYSDDR